MKILFFLSLARYHLYILAGLVLAGLLFLLSPVLNQLFATEKGQVLKSILERKEMIVLTRNAPTTYYYGPDGQAGYEFDLVSAYAEHLGVDFHFNVLKTIEEVLEALAAGQGDFAAAGLTLTESRQDDFLFGPPYFQVQQQLVCRKNGNIPGSIQEMKEVSIEVAAQSSYAQRLSELEDEIPGLSWQEKELATEQILERVWQRKVDCAVADSNIVSLNRRYFPELVVAFPIAEEEKLAWVLPSDAFELKQSMEDWFSQVDDTLSEKLYGRYYAYVQIFDYVDTAKFKRRIQNRLPSYEKIFKQAAQKYDIDWKLLAAMAYQESHWEPHARSPTGVRGIMMLTQPTARQLGVENRLDPGQSIMGGARYFADLYERIPEEVPEPDRTWFALAAYNVGMGHVFDARHLARKLDKDPNSWIEFKEVLPLLAQPEYYRDLRYGYARGGEPVRFVIRTRNYYDILRNELSG